MKKNFAKKLCLHRETLRELTRDQLTEGAGGAGSDRTVCVCPTLSVGNCVTRKWTNCNC